MILQKTALRYIKFGAVLIAFACSPSTDQQAEAEQTNLTNNQNTMKDKTPKVTGIGGIFFKTKTRRKPVNGMANTLAWLLMNMVHPLKPEMPTDLKK